MFCTLMDEIESLCQQKFDFFNVCGYTKQVVAGLMYQVAIKVKEEGDTPFVHCKVLKHLPHTGKEPEIMAFKANQAEGAPFNFTEEDGVMRTQLEAPVVENADAATTNEEMKDES